jgi:aldehyde:ferredoxin oxidoreductase
MTATATPATRTARDFHVSRYHVDLAARTVRYERVACEDLEDALGGAARAYKILENCPVDDAYDPRATLVLNLGLLSGSQFMTGLRTFFHAYSPLKTSNAGKPSAMWTAGSCKFGTKLRFLGIDEVLFTGRADRATLLRIVRNDGDPALGPAKFLFEDGADLVGRRVNDRIQTLHGRFPDAHFAVVGPAGENFRNVRFAAIALSSENQFASGDPKPRWCGRGGIGGVMGSKNLVAIAADVKDPPPAQQPAALKPLNQEVARGKGSARFREKKTGGGGGTWANYEALGPVHAVPEFNFAPTGTDVSKGLWRPEVEKGPYVVKDEACYRCGIRCHKNVYDRLPDGKPGKFRAKLDYEPLNLFASNIGVFDVGEACDLVELCDEMGMDSISCGVTIAYAMEFNRRHAAEGRTIAGGIAYGDFAATKAALVALGEGRLPELGQGSKRLADSLGETAYAMHSKGMEYPAYLPQTNPGYPFALAGGHMSMRTYLLLVFEKETGLDYWVEAITTRGPNAMRDDILGSCKFAALSDAQMAEAVGVLTGLAVTADDLRRVVRRTYLRGYRIERRQGYGPADYSMPADVHRKNDAIRLPYFNTPEFFGQVRERVLATFDRMAAEEGLAWA